MAALAWERVELPTGTVAQPVDAPIATGSASSGPLTFGASVVDHRTVVLASGQGPGGQAGGETDYGASDDLGVPNATFTLSPPTGLSATRATNVPNVSRFTPFVVQFAP